MFKLWFNFILGLNIYFILFVSKSLSYMTISNKRRYSPELINIYDLLEKCERRLFTKIKNNVNHPLYALLPEVKESSKKLRSQTELNRIEQNCYFNRIRFQYNLAI